MCKIFSKNINKTAQSKLKKSFDIVIDGIVEKDIIDIMTDPYFAKHRKFVIHVDIPIEMAYFNNYVHCSKNKKDSIYSKNIYINYRSTYKELYKNNEYIRHTYIPNFGIDQDITVKTITHGIDQDAIVKTGTSTPSQEDEVSTISYDDDYDIDYNIVIEKIF